jgi:hypothetical protein
MNLFFIPSFNNTKDIVDPPQPSKFLIPDWYKNVQMRMEWIFGRANLVGESAGDRMGAAAQAWSIYWENPLLGHGLGSMDQLMGDVGTHNMILRHMLEYGILGVLIFPLFINYLTISR